MILNAVVRETFICCMAADDDVFLYRTGDSQGLQDFEMYYSGNPEKAE